MRSIVSVAVAALALLLVPLTSAAQDDTPAPAAAGSTAGLPKTPGALCEAAPEGEAQAARAGDRRGPGDDDRDDHDFRPA